MKFIRKQLIAIIGWFLLGTIAVLLVSPIALGQDTSNLLPVSSHFERPVLPGDFTLAQRSGAPSGTTLASWQFDPVQHQLTFVTSQGVQPRARLLPNPVRFVLDLPGVRLGGAPVTQTIGGAYKSISVAEVDARTTRIILELAPGYSLDPQAIEVRGSSPMEWSAQLPVPVAASPSETTPTPGAAQGQLAVVESVRLEGDRLLIQADRPLQYDHGWDRSTSDYRIRIFQATISPQFSRPDLAADSPVRQIRLVQETPDTVTVFVKPAAGSRVGRIAQTRRGLLALEVGQTASAPPTAQFPRNPGTVPVGQAVVVVDPGHGGPDPGAVGIGGLREKDIVFPISLEVASLLEQQGIRVVLTRVDDRDLGLEPRVQLARQVRANLFVSIHANAISLSRPDVNGVETYYYESGLGLARAIHQTLVGSTGSRDRGVRRARFYVLRHTSMPAVLVETGFVTGAEDAPRLADPGFRSRIAAGIAQGVLNYLR